MDPVVLVAAGDSHPLIDIDLTLLIQLGLFGVMYVVTDKMLFQPYLRLRERRSKGIDGARAEADRMQAEADARLADYERRLARARDRAADRARAIRAEASSHERDLTAKARASAQAALDEASARVESETEAARRELLPQAEALARVMASRLLGREVS